MHFTDDELVKRLNRIANTASNRYGDASTIYAGVERIAALRAEVERLTAENDRLWKLPEKLNLVDIVKRNLELNAKVQHREAEVERLRNTVSMMESDKINAEMNLEHLTSEAERLRAENERLNALEASWIESENVMLREENHELEAENKRLRAELPKWTETSIQKPPVGVSVLLCSHDGFGCLAVYQGKRDDYRGFDQYFVGPHVEVKDVLCWMSKPEVPEIAKRILAGTLEGREIARAAQEKGETDGGR